MIAHNEPNITPIAYGQKPSVLDFTNLSACAKKVRQPGYWKIATEFIDGIPVEVTMFIKDVSSTACKYDRKQIDPACAAAKCPRIGGEG